MMLYTKYVRYTHCSLDLMFTTECYLLPTENLFTDFGPSPHTSLLTTCTKANVDTGQLDFLKR